MRAKDGRLYGRLINSDRGGYLGYATRRKYLKFARSRRRVGGMAATPVAVSLVRYRLASTSRTSTVRNVTPGGAPRGASPTLSWSAARLAASSESKQTTATPRPPAALSQ